MIEVRDFTTNFANRRKKRKVAAMTIVCQFHCDKVNNVTVSKVNLQTLTVFSFYNHRRRELTPCWIEPNTDCITLIMSVFFVNFFMPRKPLSCWRAMVMAAPPMKPTMAAWDKKSIRNPSLIPQLKFTLNKVEKSWGFHRNISRPSKLTSF